MNFRILSQLSAALAAVALAGATAAAAPITFTHQGTAAAGAVGGVAFGSTAFTITAFGDTDNREAYDVVPGAEGFFIDHGSARIELASVGEFLFTTATRTFNTRSITTAGFSRAGAIGTDLVNGPTLPALATWDMLSSIGPLSGSGQILQWDSSPVHTSGGQLLLEGGASPIVFTATVVPEPTALALAAALGAIGAAGGRRGRGPR